MLKQIDLFNLKLNHVRIFIEAAEYGSFSAAAERLHVTQPMVSKTIQNIQQELGLILFVRDHGKMQLTPAGSLSGILFWKDRRRRSILWHVLCAQKQSPQSKKNRFLSPISGQRASSLSPQM